MASTMGAVRQAIVTNIDIQVLDPHNWPGSPGGNASLSSSMCRPGSMESDVHETILEAAELLQEHAPYREGDIGRCYSVIAEAVRECGNDGTVVRDLDHGARLEVKVSQGPGFLI